jgi:uncharacterized membrane protein YcfT
MSSMQALQWLQESWLARAVSESSFLVGAGLQIVHISGLFLLFAAVVLISLRLLGLILRDHPVTLLSRAVTRFIWTGLALAFTSGLLMFMTTPARYALSQLFLLKMGFFVVGVLLQLLLFRPVAARDFPPAGLARVTVFASLGVWLVVAWAGRFIGFV